MTRKQIEDLEKKTLALYAVKSVESKGREYPEKEDPYRTCFQRDRDRIIHSKSFRRLKGKTQVFVAHYGDHYRSRLTHTMEVAQLSRDIARMLGLNEDLSESIALAHDLGHTPFGHAGQEAMHEIMKSYGGRFEHNEQSRCVVERLEEKTGSYPGLNLTFEVRDGLIKHRTSYDKPESPDIFMPSLEAQVVNIADEIAYLNHDIDDGLRAGILKMDNLQKLEIFQEANVHVSSNLPLDFYIHAMISALITLMVNDLVQMTDQYLKRHKIKMVDDVCRRTELIAIFSDPMSQRGRELKEFLYRYFYQSEGVREYNRKGKDVIHALFKAYYDKPERLPEKIQEYLKTEKRHIVVKDYISGMTDNFALEIYDKLG